ncbi:MAG: elongation factor Ts [Candidatus Omnitrophica bacterium]|nr:elongation factor Ts [Candidatus Omnitrophota bacterium]
MEITVDAIKELREMTSCGVIECKNALEEAGGDMDKAKKILQRRGLELAAKKGGREAKEGRVEAYIHQGAKIGVIVEVNCETDFVARNSEFKRLTRDIAMQVAASKPSYLNIADIPEKVIEKEKEIFKEQILSNEKNKKKPKEVINKIIDSKLQKFYEETCLLEQPFIKDQKLKVKGLIEQAIVTLGENIVVRRFARYQLGEEL